jgi:PTS system cellobiose-specific IIA component
MEDVTLGIILHAGNARSKCLLAIKEAKTGNFALANTYLQEAKDEVVLAHQIQTDLIHQEVCGEKIDLTLFMVHAQDHLMTTLTIRELAIELVDYMEKVEERLTGKGGESKT